MKTIFERLNYCMAYYPELRDNECLEQDIAYFKQLHVNCVRIMEFAWDMLEPERGRYDFSYFDFLIERLAREGISVIIGTPTATPPAWFTHSAAVSPYYTTNKREKMYHGIREHVCINHEEFIERTRLLVENMAKHYGKNKNVIAWQIHNEFNWPTKDCYCDTCRSKFRVWLQEKYKDIQTLNRAWNTRIWSQTYFSFEDVDPPYEMFDGGFATFANPPLKNAYIDFNHDSVYRFCKMQADIIRKYSDAPITTNVNRAFYLNFERLFSCLDFVSFDEYCGQKNCEEFLLDNDLWAGLCENPVMLMETAVSHGGGIMGGANNAHKRGFVKAEALSLFLSGACGFGFWIFRQHWAGMEQVHGHVISAWGEPSAYYKSAEDVRDAIEELSSFVRETERVKPEVQLVYSDVSRRIFTAETLGEVDYNRDFMHFYRAVLNLGWDRAVSFEKKAYSDCKLLLVPLLPYVGEELIRIMDEVTAGGGTVIVGPHTGTREAYGTVHKDMCLGALQKYLGIRVKYYTSLDNHDAVADVFGSEVPLGGYSIIMQKTEHTAAYIRGGWCDGDSILEEVPKNKGKIVVLGTMFGEDILSRIFMQYNRAEVSGGFGTAYYRRKDGDGKIYHCFVNMLSEDSAVKMNGKKLKLRAGECLIV